MKLMKLQFHYQNPQKIEETIQLKLSIDIDIKI